MPTQTLVAASHLQLGQERSAEWASTAAASYVAPPAEAVRAGAAHAGKGAAARAAGRSTLQLGTEAAEWATDTSRHYVAHPVAPRQPAGAPGTELLKANATSVAFGSDAFAFDGGETDYRRMFRDPGPAALVLPGRDR
jgi:hypothetical protein